MDEIIQAGKFLREQMRIIEPQIIRQEYSEMWGFNGLYHTVKPGLRFGVSEISNINLETTGKAVTYGGKANDIPLANFGIGKDSISTLMGIFAAEWDWTELQQQEQANASGMSFGIDVVREKRGALERGLKEWVHSRTLFGEKGLGFFGLFNNPEIEVKVITDNLYSLSAMQLYLFFKSELKDFRKESLLTGKATKLRVSPDLYDALTDPLSVDNSAATAHEMLTDSSKGTAVSSIDEILELGYDYLLKYGHILASANQDMFVIMDDSEDTLDKLFSGIRTTPVGLKDDQMTYRTTGMVKISEVRVKRPHRIRYYLHPKQVG